QTLRDGVNDGKIAALIVKSRSGETAVPNLDALQRYLKQKRTEAETLNKDSVRIIAESKLTIGPLVEVMDTCLASGFGTAIFAPPPDMGVGRPLAAKMAS